MLIRAQQDDYSTMMSQDTDHYNSIVISQDTDRTARTLPYFLLNFILVFNYLKCILKYKIKANLELHSAHQSTAELKNLLCPSKNNEVDYSVAVSQDTDRYAYQSMMSRLETLLKGPLYEKYNEILSKFTTIKHFTTMDKKGILNQNSKSNCFQNEF